MKTFKEFLNERTGQMTFDLALDTFGLTPEEVSDKDILKKKYRELAIVNHPDKPGGSHEKMQDINDAYELLSKSKISTSSKTDRESIDKKYRMAGAQIKNSLLSSFKPDVFVKYFEDMSGLKFNYEILKTFPLENDRSPHYAGFDSEFFTDDRNTVFTFNVMANLVDVIYPKSELGYGDLSYDVNTTAHGFHLNKKQKLSQRDWKFTRDHSFFKKPEAIFPKAKLKKIFSGKTSKRAFKKRDMETFLSKKLQAKIERSSGQTQAAIPLDDNYTFIIFRSVFMKQGSWSPIGVYLKTGKYGYGKKVGDVAFGSLPETEDTAKIFEKIQKEAKKTKGDKKVKKVEELFKTAYENWKKSIGA